MIKYDRHQTHVSNLVGKDKKGRMHFIRSKHTKLIHSFNNWSGRAGCILDMSIILILKLGPNAIKNAENF